MNFELPSGTVGSTLPSASALPSSHRSGRHRERSGGRHQSATAGSGYRGCVGRVGALAVALGIGAAVGAPGLAYADSTGSAGAASTADSTTATERSPRTQTGPRRGPVRLTPPRPTPAELRVRRRHRSVSALPHLRRCPPARGRTAIQARPPRRGRSGPRSTSWRRRWADPASPETSKGSRRLRYRRPMPSRRCRSCRPLRPRRRHHHRQQSAVSEHRRCPGWDSTPSAATVIRLGRHR